MRSKALGGAALALLALSAVPGSAADKIGSAVRIVNKVTGEIDQQQRQLKTDDAVNQNEAIEVSSDSLGELKLNDDTKLALGPGARLVLDKFVYDPAPSTGTVSVNLLTGAFRFITGLSRKGDYQLRTPSASITVRGTIFDVYVDGAGGTWLLLLEGSVRICNAANQCADVSNPCGVVHITPTGALDGPIGWPAEARPINFATAFPFVVTPPSIDATPLFTRTAVELNQCAPKQLPAQRAEAPPSPPSPTTPATPSPKTPSAPQQSYTPPPPPPYNEQPAPPPYTPVVTTTETAPRWGGLYVGVVAGAVWQQPDSFLNCFDFTNPDPSVCSTDLSFRIPGNFFNLNDTGFLGGAQIGYNITFGNVVVGAEADIAYTSIETTSTFQQPFPCCVRDTFMHQELQSLSTVRARLGYTFENILLYATGGLAVGQVEYAFGLTDDQFVGGGFAGASNSQLKAGYTTGGGIEISFGQWSLKTEYLFYDLGRETLTAPFLIGGVPEPFTFRPEFDTQGHILRVGTNFPLN
jgi:opacity protein-like surface antigen